MKLCQFALQIIITSVIRGAIKRDPKFLVLVLYDVFERKRKKKYEEEKIRIKKKNEEEEEEEEERKKKNK